MSKKLQSMSHRVSKLSSACRAMGSELVESFSEVHNFPEDRGDRRHTQRQDVIKNAILDHVEEAERRLLQTRLPAGDFHLVGCEYTDMVCCGVEAMLLHGLQGNQDESAKNIWQLLVQCTPEQVLQDLAVAQKHCHLGMTRAYVRDMINTQGGPVGFHNILLQEKSVQRVIRTMYKTYAMLRDEAKRAQLVSKLDALQSVFTFTLRLDHPALSAAWPQHALDLMQGLQLSQDWRLTPRHPRPASASVAVVRVQTPTRQGDKKVTKQNKKKEECRRTGATVKLEAIAPTNTAKSEPQAQHNVTAVTSVKADDVTLIKHTSETTLDEPVSKEPLSAGEASVDSELRTDNPQPGSSEEKKVDGVHCKDDMLLGVSAPSDFEDIYATGQQACEEMDMYSFEDTLRLIREISHQDEDQEADSSQKVEFNMCSVIENPSVPTPSNHNEEVESNLSQNENDTDSCEEPKTASLNNETDSSLNSKSVPECLQLEETLRLAEEKQSLKNTTQNDFDQGYQDDLNNTQDDSNIIEDDLNTAQDDLNTAQDDLNTTQDVLNTVQDDLNQVYQDLLKPNTEAQLEQSVNKLRDTLCELRARQKVKEMEKQKSLFSIPGSRSKWSVKSVASHIKCSMKALLRKEAPEHPMDLYHLQRRQEKFLDKYALDYSLSTAQKMRESTRCAVCNMKFEENKFRVCHMSGQRCCHFCHTNKKALIPYNIMHSFDFNKYPVCDVAHDLLKERESRAWMDDFCFQSAGETTFASLTATSICLRGRVVLYSWTLGDKARDLVADQQRRLTDITAHNTKAIRLFSVQELLLVKEKKLHKLLVQSLKKMERQVVKRHSPPDLSVVQGDIEES